MWISSQLYSHSLEKCLALLYKVVIKIVKKSGTTDDLLPYHHEVVYMESRFEYQCIFLQRHSHRTNTDNCDRINQSKLKKVKSTINIFQCFRI